MNSAQPLAGKTALVTGATRGLGRAIAEGLSTAGATVIISSRKSDACERVAREIEQQTGGRAVPFAMHVGRWDELADVLDRMEAEAGPIDVLVNNAGIAPQADSLEVLSEALFDKTIEVNLKGPFRLMALVGARMKRNGGGSIINISSIGAVRPSPSEAVYSAAKNGLNALTQAFAQEYAPEVRVNCVMPGAFATDMSDDWPPEFVHRIIDGLPAGRLGQAQELVGSVVYLAGDQAGYTTGVLLPVDGGRTTIY